MAPRKQKGYVWSTSDVMNTPFILPKEEQERILAERPPELQHLLNGLDRARKSQITPMQWDRLTKSLELDQAWREEAACRGMEADLFFPEKYCNATEIKKICREQCSVRQECLDYALEIEAGSGIWGGTSARERRDYLFSRKRARRASA